MLPNDFGIEIFRPVRKNCVLIISERGDFFLLLTIDFFEHSIHIFEVIVVEEPHGFVVVILVEGHCGRG